LTQAELGAVDEAREELEALAIDDGSKVPYVARASSLALLVETGAEVGDAEHSARAYEVLLPHSGQLLVVGWGAACLGAADRFLGVAAANTGRWDDAERHFEAAVALEEAAGSAPLLARTQFSYARALAARGRRLDRTRALDLLDAAAVAADELDLGGLQLGLGALRDRLR